MMKDNRYATMKKIILTSMILVPFIPFILVIGIGFYYFTTSLEANTISSMKRIVRDHSQMIDSFLMERKADLEFIVNSYSFNDINRPDRLVKLFEDLQSESNAFADLGVFNESGVHVAYLGLIS